MLFDSIDFIVFFPLATLGYYLLPHRNRWMFLLAASCLFYMSFIPAYILILAITILIDYFAALRIEDSHGKVRKWFLIMSIISTCLVLFIFKYFDFFSGNVTALSKFFHLDYTAPLLRLILPIGLSFHTFQSLSYVIEVYRGTQKAEHHFGIYALYVMFYPQLVAGPIERPNHLLRQFREEHIFNYENVTNGLRRMAWGLFKKVVIADRLAVFVNRPFNNPGDYKGINFILASILFGFQIYCDFSGYSDIAIGAAQVMGFRLMENFRSPYFSKSIAEFWRRWHISLSTWFRDYVYFPLGGGRVSKPRWYFNLFVVFLISGLWHGASWTFLIWGLLHWFYLVFGSRTRNLREEFRASVGLSKWPRLGEALQAAVTFSLVCFSWIFFRANSSSDAFYIVSHLFDGVGDFAISILRNASHLNSGKHLLEPLFVGQTKMGFLVAVSLIGFMEVVHLLERRQNIFERLAALPIFFRWSIYALLVTAILNGGQQAKIPFMYFQF